MSATKSRARTKSPPLTSFLSKKEFASLALSAATKRAIAEVFGYKTMSVPQSQFMPHMLDPAAPDVFVRASTGSGKTLGFLLPAVEAAAAGRGTTVVLSPARELALQTLEEAKKLLTYHAGRTAVAFVGGTDKHKNVAALRGSRLPDIIIATPGRLEDLMKDAQLRAVLAGGVRMAVLDEADRLLDMGFVAPIKRILSAFSPDRRTLLFTATVPEEVKEVAKGFMRTGFRYVDTAGDAPDQGQITHRAVVVPPACVHVALRAVLDARRKDPDHKVLVFFPSNQMVELFAKAHTPNVMALHGKMPQNVRTRNSEAFRTGTARVLFASDVAGRGMDFPGVTTVVQVGVAGPDVYKQRAGRTGRAGKRGEAVLLLGTDERRVLDGVKAVAPGMEVAELPPCTAEELRANALPPGALGRAKSAFKGVLGAYNSQLRVLGWTGQQLLDNIAQRFRGMGLQQLPDISDKLLAKMGLRGVKMPSQVPIKAPTPLVRGSSAVKQARRNSAPPRPLSGNARSSRRNPGPPRAASAARSSRTRASPPRA